ncbi:MAG TPA: hypothetical protein ACFYD3_05665 [Candidatus Hypogeohydataceae bacterium YC41]
MYTEPEKKGTPEVPEGSLLSDLISWLQQNIKFLGQGLGWWLTMGVLVFLTFHMLYVLLILWQKDVIMPSPFLYLLSYQLAEPYSLRGPDEIFVKLENLPEVKFTNSLGDRIHYDNDKKLLIFKGIMTEEEENKLLGLSKDNSYQKAIEALLLKSQGGKPNEIIIGAIIAFIMGGVGSVIFCFKSLFEGTVEKPSLTTAGYMALLFRPLYGSLLALIFYFLIRGGLIAFSGGDVHIPKEGDPLDIMRASVAGVSGLVGMFAKEAMDKLREVFETLFAPKKAAEEKKAEEKKTS